MEQLPFLSPNEEGWAEISPNISILNETNYIGTCLALYNARHSMWNEIFSPFRGSIHFSVSSPRGEFSPRNRIKGTVSSLPFPLTISSQEFQSTCIQFSISRIERSIVFIYLYGDDSILSFFFFYLIRFLNSIDKNYLIRPAVSMEKKMGLKNPISLGKNWNWNSVSVKIYIEMKN